MANVIRCNRCGKELLSKTEDTFHLYKRMEPGTKYNTHVIEIDLCGKCTDEWIDQIRNEFMVDVLLT